MILQALYELCDRESLLGENPHYVMKKVSWVVRYGDKGCFLGIIDNRAQVIIPSKTTKGKDKVQYVPRYLWVPREPERTSGDYAFFLCDTTEYVFGVEAPAKKGAKRPAKKLKNRHNLFKEKVKQCYENTGDEAIYNLLLFLDKIERDPYYMNLPDECDSSDLLTFSYAPDHDLLVVERPAIKKYWEDVRRNSIQQNPMTNCLVSGEYTFVIDKLPLVKKLPGGTPSGVALVSFNAPAFESYGLKGNQNASVSWLAAEKCITALNRLLDPAPPTPATLKKSWLGDPIVLVRIQRFATGRPMKRVKIFAINSPQSLKPTPMT